MCNSQTPGCYRSPSMTLYSKFYIAMTIFDIEDRAHQRAHSSISGSQSLTTDYSECNDMDIGSPEACALALCADDTVDVIESAATPLLAKDAYS